jgi:hypothetical protein
MKVIPGTSREHEIGYLRFYICIYRVLHLNTLKHMFDDTFLYMYIYVIR